MYRPNQCIYCKTPEIAEKVKAYAKKLNAESRIMPEQPEIPTNSIPEFIKDIMDGGAFPNMEELSREEQALLYNPQILQRVNLYRQTRGAGLAFEIGHLVSILQSKTNRI